MKIGILTFFNTYNHGSCLQAYAVQKLLKYAFPEDMIEIINYVPLRGLIKESLINFYPRKWYWPIISIKNFFKFNNFQKNYLLSKEKYIGNDYEQAINFINRLNYDVLFTGSDTVFEIKDKKKSYVPGFKNIYWLPKELKVLKRFSISASADQTDKNLINEDLKQFIISSLKNFSLIGIRDKFTEQLILEIYNEPDKIFKMPDPTFFIDIPKTSVKDKLIKLGVKLDKPILGIHLGNKILSKQISDYFRSKGYQIVAPVFNKYADYNLIGYIDSFEWAEVYKFFSLTITDRFHGTVFCLKNKVPFVSVDYKSVYKNNRSKKKDLLEEIDLINHLVEYDENSYINIDKFLINSIDKEKVDKALVLYKNRLLEYIEKVKEKIYES
jgi:hypothetical protein